MATLDIGKTIPTPAAEGGTGQTVYAVGDILYASTTTALSKLADVATGNAVISGGVGAIPAWGKIGLTTHISGTLAVGNGGLGITAGTSGGVPYFSGTSTIASSAALGAGLVVVGGGAGVAPATIANGQLPATATNDNAASGKVGEYVESIVLVGSAVTLTTGVTSNIAQLTSLPAGDWDVCGCVHFSANAATTVTSTIGGINTASATLPTQGNPGFVQNPYSPGGNTLANIPSAAMPSMRISLSTPTTVFLVARSNFAVNSMAAFGYICARRVR